MINNQKQRTHNHPLLTTVRDYWDQNIHDKDITTHPVGTFEFYRDLDEYRFEKLDYLSRSVNFDGYRDKKILEIGCGAAIDLVRFAGGGAIASGIDCSSTAIYLAQKNLSLNNMDADLFLMDGENLGFKDNIFDLVYAHGVLQYTPNPSAIVAEALRVLQPGGQAIFMMYSKFSWLNLISTFMKGNLEHDDAPVFLTISQSEFRKLLKDYKNVKIVPERFPVKTRLHHGWKAILYNEVFVPVFNMLPKTIIRPFGWHLMAYAEKAQS